MKIAIQGHPTRGKEVIKILESLGGQNIHGYWGHSGNSVYYYINKHCKIVYDSIHVLSLYDYKLYTLEEFEKEFPFKVGDKVTIIGLPDFPKIITKMVWDCDEILYSFEGLNNTWFGAKSLKKLEMKEERNITLTLDKAQEWYNKGGELREIALQAYSEEELNPKKWVDLGLPSGTLWCDTNEEGYYSWDGMNDTFDEENLPKLTDFAELYDYCEWKWDNKKKGMWVIGVNGNHIFFPASGYRYYSFGDLNFVSNRGYYWSCSPYESNSNTAYYLFFSNNGFVPPSYNNYRSSVIRSV